MALISDRTFYLAFRHRACGHLCIPDRRAAAAAGEADLYRHRGGTHFRGRPDEGDALFRAYPVMTRSIMFALIYGEMPV